MSCRVVSPPKKDHICTLCKYAQEHSVVQHISVRQRQCEAVPGAVGAGQEVVPASSSGAVITQRNSTERPCSTTQPTNAEQLLGCDSGPSPPMVVRPGAMPHVPLHGSCCGMGQPRLQVWPVPTHLHPTSEEQHGAVNKDVPPTPANTHPPALH